MRDALLVTGANGYLGAACVERLARTPTRDVIAVWHSARDRLLARPARHVRYEQCDLSDRAAVAKLFAREQIGAVAHTAALLPDGRPNYLARALDANAAATLNLLDAARESGCPRFVYCSSISIYASTPCPAGGWPELESVAPFHEYGWTKFVGEECLRLRSDDRALSGISLRLAGIHGPGRESGVVFNTISSALAAKPILLNNATQPFQLVFVGDAVDAVLAAVDAPSSRDFERVNVASHTFGSLREMAERILSACGSRSIVQLGAQDQRSPQVMNTSRMTTLLGIAPGDVGKHLQESISWISSLVAGSDEQ